MKIGDSQTHLKRKLFSLLYFQSPQLAHQTPAPKRCRFSSQIYQDWCRLAKQYAGNGSMIPANQSYKQGVTAYRYQCQKAGLDINHDLRHAYAQERYLQITGWLPPKAGGPTSKQLSPQEKESDSQARLIISKELGHEREQIIVYYLGR